MEPEIDNEVYINEKRRLVQEFIEALKLKLQEEKTFVIDRFEEEFAVCEDRETGRMINIKKEDLPEEIVEGDVLKYKNFTYEIDYEEKQKIEDRINEKVKDLFED